jgi:hypothetical protein
MSSDTVRSSYGASNPPGGCDPLHGGTPSSQINWRQDAAQYSMQISGTIHSKTRQVILNIDIDTNNPMDSAGDALRHWGTVALNKLTGKDTNYVSVAGALGIDPYQANVYCSGQ